MAITLQGENPKIGFKYSDNNTSKGTNTMTIAKNGKLLFNGARLGLTAAELEYLESAVNKNLLTNASISLTAYRNPYEKLNNNIDNFTSNVNFTLKLTVNSKIVNIVDQSGNRKNNIILQITDNKKNTANVTLQLNGGMYIATVMMNKGLTASGNSITNFIEGTCVITDDIYCSITKDNETYIIPLNKPSVNVYPGGLIYAGVNSGGFLFKNKNNDITPNLTVGATKFKSDVSSSNKGYLTLDVGFIKDSQFYVGTDEYSNVKVEPTKLDCLNLTNSVSGTTITLKEPNNAPYYGIVVLPDTINLGKFANGVVDNSAYNGKVYNATNTATNMDSPFILIASTNFAACTRPDEANEVTAPSALTNKQVTYNIYRTKNKLTNPITIRL